MKAIEVPGVEKRDDEWTRSHGFTNSENGILSIRITDDESAADAFVEANGWYVAWDKFMVEM